MWNVKNHIFPEHLEGWQIFCHNSAHKYSPLPNEVWTAGSGRSSMYWRSFNDFCFLKVSKEGSDALSTTANWCVQCRERLQCSFVWIRALMFRSMLSPTILLNHNRDLRVLPYTERLCCKVRPLYSFYMPCLTGKVSPLQILSRNKC